MHVPETLLHGHAGMYMITQSSQHLRILSSQPCSKLRVERGACVLPECLLFLLVPLSLPGPHQGSGSDPQQQGQI